MAFGCLAWCAISYVGLRWYYHFFRFPLLASYFTVALFPLYSLGIFAFFQVHIVFTLGYSDIPNMLLVLLFSFLGATFALVQLRREKDPD